ncbi:hypothetical protein pdam_00021148, partial [Pocillopora damicornis]
MALVLFIRKFPKLGIYVVMFTSILYTFTKFFMIFVLFLVAFALSFFTLFYDPQQSIRAFGEPGRAIVKTAVMMIGEFDFDDLFNSPDQDVPDVAWFIFIVFLIIMTLILMNLLQNDNRLVEVSFPETPKIFAKHEKLGHYVDFRELCIVCGG